MNWIDHRANLPDLDRAGLRRFGLITAVLLMLSFGVLLPWAWAGSPNWPVELIRGRLPSWPWVIGLMLASWALFAPATLRTPYRVWMLFAAVLGAINSRIILGVVFLIVFVPIGLIVRLTSGNPMMRTGPNGSFRIPSRSRKPDHMERPF